MKHRTKNNPTDDFNFFVNYEVELTIAEQKKLEEDIPQTPKVNERSSTNRKSG